MWRVLEWMLLAGAAAAVAAPLLYGMGTLRGLKRKTFFPLLRGRKRDGTQVMMKVEHGPAHRTI